jgi:hypothetical protein
MGLAYLTGQQLDNSGDLPKHSEKAYARDANMLQLIAPKV